MHLWELSVYGYLKNGDCFNVYNCTNMYTVQKTFIVIKRNDYSYTPWLNKNHKNDSYTWSAFVYKKIYSTTQQRPLVYFELL